MIGNRFPFAVRVGGEINCLGFLGGILELFQNRGFALDDHIIRLKTVLDINTELRLRQVNYMTNRRLDRIVLPKKLRQSLRFGR